MKTPKEYLNFIEFAEVDASEAGVFYFADNLEKGELIKLIKQVQKEAWNEALDKAVENVELTIEGSDYHSMTYQDLGSDDLVMVDIDSLLKLKL